MPESQQPRKSQQSRKGRRTGQRAAGERAASGKDTTPSPEPERSGERYVQEEPGGPGREELLARGLVQRAPWRGGVAGPEPPAAGFPPTAAPAPVQATVNRHVPPEVFFLDEHVPIGDGKDLILRRPAGYPSGMLPGDPGPFRPGFDPRLGVCHVLSPVAAARCLAGRGYF